MLSTKEADRNVFLINPFSSGLKPILGKSVGLPIGLAVVGSEVERIKEQAGFKDDEVNIHVIDESLDRRIRLKPRDLVLISSFSLNAKRVKMLAQQFIIQGADVVVGGIHATVAPDDFTKVGAISFMGEAGNSKVFDELIKQWLYTGRLKQGIKLESEGVANPQAISLVDLPVSEKVYKQLDEKSISHMLVGTVGCTKCCTTCSVMGGRVVRKRPIDEIVSEMVRRGGNKMGFSLTDSDMAADLAVGGMGGEAYLYPLLESFAGLKIPRGMSGETTIEALALGGAPLFKALAKAQFHRLFVGIESDNVKNLLSIGKRHNVEYDADKVKEIVRSVHKQGIKMTGLFIVGFLPETVESIRGIEEYIKETGLDDANISILTPLPGTAIWRQFANEGRFNPTTVDTDKLDFHHLVFNHQMEGEKYLGNKELLREYKELCNRAFSLREVLKRSNRAFWMSHEKSLPESLERQFRNSFGVALLQAYLHRRKIAQ